MVSCWCSLHFPTNPLIQTSRSITLRLHPMIKDDQRLSKSLQQCPFRIFQTHLLPACANINMPHQFPWRYCPKKSQKTWAGTDFQESRVELQQVTRSTWFSHNWWSEQKWVSRSQTFRNCCRNMLSQLEDLENAKIWKYWKMQATITVSLFNQWMTSRKIAVSIVRASIHAGFFAVTCIDNEKHVSLSIGTERNVQGAKKMLFTTPIIFITVSAFTITKLVRIFLLWLWEVS